MLVSQLLDESQKVNRIKSVLDSIQKVLIDLCVRVSNVEETGKKYMCTVPRKNCWVRVRPISGEKVLPVCSVVNWFDRLQSDASSIPLVT
jgi:hypothetical protein